MTADPAYYKEIIADCVAWVEGSGTAFFIDNNLLLTCTHVVEGKAEVLVRRFEANKDLRAAVLPGGLPKDAGDLTLLQLIDEVADQQAVLLHLLEPGDLATQREVILAGFPRDDQNKPGRYEPCPATIHPRLVDRATLEALIFDTPAEVAPGLSGSPVLDLATGTVIGITRYRKGARADTGTGGGAIPVALAVQTFPQVRAVYEHPPEAARIWLARRDEDELRAIGRERKGTTGRLDLRLGGTLDEWSVHVGNDDPEVIRLDVLGVNVTRAVFQWTRGRRTSTREDLQLVGEILWAALLHGKIGNRYEAWHQEADDLTIRLITEPQCQIVDLPWEYARSASGGASLGLDEKLALARVMPGDSGAGPLPEARSSASVVALVVQPDPLKYGYPSMTNRDSKLIGWPTGRDIEEDIKKATAQLQLREVITNPPRSRLEQLARSGPCDVLHYQGFARVITPTSIQLSLYDENAGDVTPVDISKIADVARRVMAKVVVIETHAAPASEYNMDDPAMRIAAPLLAVGVIAVLTTRFPVHPTQAFLFNQDFYASLAAGMTVERAAQAGRAKVDLDDRLGDGATFGAFVLWTADMPGLRLVAPASQQAVPGDQPIRAGQLSGTDVPTAAGSRPPQTPRDSSALGSR